MTGFELDKRLREILLAVTKETAFTSAAEITKLGLPASAALALVCEAVEAKEKVK